MRQFKYAGLSSDGQKVGGVVKGESLHSVTTELLDQGVHIEDVKEHKSALQFEITPHKVKLVGVMHFSRQLASFVRAGVPLLDALEIVREETDDKVLVRVLGEVQADLRQGANFATAMATHTNAFPPFYVSVLASAEVTGRLDQVLDQLSKYIERDLEARRKIKSALAYPAVIFLM